MIELSALTAAIAALIHAETGVFAIDERLQTTVYPSYYVGAAEKNTTVVAGGRQLLRHIEVSVRCAPDRTRGDDETRAGLHLLYGVFLPSFPATGRRFAPIALMADDDGVLRFSLEFCDLPPEKQTVPSALMDELALSLGADGNNTD